MLYKKSFSKNKKKNRSNVKRRRHNTINKKEVANKSYKKRDVAVNINTCLSARYIFILLFVTGIALMVLYYKSILIYWQQTYHSDLFHSNTLIQDSFPEEQGEESSEDAIAQTQDSTITKDSKHEPQVNKNVNPIEQSHPVKPIIIQPDAIKRLSKDKIKDEILPKDKSLSDKNKQVESSIKKPLEKSNKAPTLLPAKEKDELPKVQIHDVPLIHQPLPIVLTENDKVFFAGDSLMQGVAPYVKKMLFKQYKIESIDLSKQSTGLAYPNAFDWPKTISDTLADDPTIKLLVVFLGPNDPWDFPVKGYAKYAKFKSELWEEQYRLRIANILSNAREHHIQVLWLAAPCMRKPKLNDGMVYLNTLYKSEIDKTQQHFLTTNELLGCTYEKFNSFIETNNEKIKVRVDDGVHFTPTGQKILAKAIMEKIIFKELEGTHSD